MRKSKVIKKKWGCEKVIVNNKNYCGKILIFKKNKKCSYHYHNIKKETFFLRSGRLLLRYGRTNIVNESKELILNPGDIFDVPSGLRHQIIALEDSELFEFSTQHFEKDSIRIVKSK